MIQDKTNRLIFPYNSRNVIVGFPRVWNKLCLGGLRQEGIFTLFDKGYGIEELA